MKRLLAIGAALAALGATQPRAEASSCGGGGGGSRGGGGGGGGGGFAEGMHSARNDCSDASDVVGYRKCTKFGAWGQNLRSPRVIIEAGALVRQFPSLLDGQTGSFTHGSESFSYRVLAPTTRRRSTDTAVLSTMRVRLGLPHHFYAGAEVDLGGLAQPGHATMEMMSTGVFGDPDVQQHGGFVLDSLATVGLRSAIGAGTLGVELAGGVRSVWYSFHSDYHNCAQSTTITAVAPIAELRARGELWVSPWLTAGVTVGTSVLDKAAWMGGLYVGVHSRAFSGER